MLNARGDRREVLRALGCLREKSTTALCRTALGDLFHLIQRETLTPAELDEAFLAATELFHSAEPSLRRLLFPALRALRNAPSFCMATSAAARNASEGAAPLRAAALRLLPLFAGQINAAQIERQLRAGLSHESALVVEGALLACAELSGEEAPRRCLAELQALAVGGRPGVEGKALKALCAIWRNDPAALARFLATLAQSPPESEDCALFAARATGETLRRDAEERFLDGKLRAALIAFLFQLAREADAKGIEAATALLGCADVENGRLRPIVAGLCALLGESEAANFAVLGFLRELQRRSCRAALLPSVGELHALLQSENRSLAALALGVLLKAANENGLEALLARVAERAANLSTEAMAEIASDCVSLARRLPRTTPRIARFLCERLGDAREAKLALIASIAELGRIAPDCRGEIVEQLCEQLEEASDGAVSLRLIEQFPALVSDAPTALRCLRHLLNRLTLDEGAVRLSAVSCLASLAARAELRAPVRSVLAALARSDGGEAGARAAAHLARLDAQRAIPPLFVKEKVVECAAALRREIADGRESVEGFDFERLCKAERAEEPRERERVEQCELGAVLLAGVARPLSDEGSDFHVRARTLILEEGFGIEFVLQSNLDSEACELRLQALGEGLQPSKSVGQTSVAARGRAKLFLFFAAEQCLVAGALSAALHFRVGHGARSYADEIALEEFEVRPADFLAPLAAPIDAAAFEREWLRAPAAAAQSYELEQFGTVAAAAAELAKHFGVSLCGELADGAGAHTLRLAGRYRGTRPFFVRAQLGADPKSRRILANVAAKADSERLCAALVEL